MRGFVSFLIFDCFGRLPLRFRQICGTLLGRCIAFFPSREREIAWLHLKILRITPHPQKTIDEMFAHLGRSIFESLNPAPLLIAQRVMMTHESEDVLSKIIASKRGILALTAHCGNWDLLGAYFASRGLPIHTVGRSSRNPMIQYLLETLRTKCGVQTIWRDAASGVKKIIELFRNGGILAALIDQDTQVHSVFAPFFGVAAKTPVSLIEIAKRSNAITCVVLMASTSKGYEITLSALADDLSPEEMLTAYHTALEKHLMKYPSQWVWFHKRWRSLPAGVTRGGRAYIEALKRGEIPLQLPSSNLTCSEH